MKFTMEESISNDEISSSDDFGDDIPFEDMRFGVIAFAEKTRPTSHTLSLEVKFEGNGKASGGNTDGHHHHHAFWTEVSEPTSDIRKESGKFGFLEQATFDVNPDDEETVCLGFISSGKKASRSVTSFGMKLEEGAACCSVSSQHMIRKSAVRDDICMSSTSRSDAGETFEDKASLLKVELDEGNQNSRQTFQLEARNSKYEPDHEDMCFGFISSSVSVKDEADNREEIWGPETVDIPEAKVPSLMVNGEDVVREDEHTLNVVRGQVPLVKVKEEDGETVETEEAKLLPLKTKDEDVIREDEHNLNVAQGQVPLVKVKEEDDEFTCGDLVWAKIRGFPWWPGLVCDQPRSGKVHVAFYSDPPTHAWVQQRFVKTFSNSSGLEYAGRFFPTGARCRVHAEEAQRVLHMTKEQRICLMTGIASEQTIMDSQQDVSWLSPIVCIPKLNIGGRESIRMADAKRNPTILLPPGVERDEADSGREERLSPDYQQDVHWLSPTVCIPKLTIGGRESICIADAKRNPTVLLPPGVDKDEERITQDGESLENKLVEGHHTPVGTPVQESTRTSPSLGQNGRGSQLTPGSSKRSPLLHGFTRVRKSRRGLQLKDHGRRPTLSDTRVKVHVKMDMSIAAFTEHSKTFNCNQCGAKLSSSFGLLCHKLGHQKLVQPNRNHDVDFGEVGAEQQSAVGCSSVNPVQNWAVSSSSNCYSQVCPDQNYAVDNSQLSTEQDYTFGSCSSSVCQYQTPFPATSKVTQEQGLPATTSEVRFRRGTDRDHTIATHFANMPPEGDTSASNTGYRYMYSPGQRFFELSLASTDLELVLEDIYAGTRPMPGEGMMEDTEYLYRMEHYQAEVPEATLDEPVSESDSGDLGADPTTRVSESDDSSSSDNLQEAYICSRCGRRFQHYINLKAHERIHSGEKTYKCTHCGKHFMHLKELKAHELKHTEGKPRERNLSREKHFKCGDCGKSFRQSRDLKSHRRKHTGESGERPFKCNLCEKSFCQSNTLNIHKRKHTGEKPFKCSFCKKCFATSSGRNVHERKHTGEEPFSCIYCDKSFKQSSNLRVHERRHTGEKPFQCATCSKRFCQSSDLRLHERKHSGEKPFECKYCDKCFAQKSNRKVHERIHVGVKPFKCSYCYQRFGQSSNVTKHEKIHVGYCND